MKNLDGKSECRCSSQKGLERVGVQASGVGVGKPPSLMVNLHAPFRPALGLTSRVQPLKPAANSPFSGAFRAPANTLGSRLGGRPLHSPPLERRMASPGNRVAEYTLGSSLEWGDGVSVVDGSCGCCCCPGEIEVKSEFYNVQNNRGRGLGHKISITVKQECRYSDYSGSIAGSGDVAQCRLHWNELVNAVPQANYPHGRAGRWMKQSEVDPGTITSDTARLGFEQLQGARQPGCTDLCTPVPVPALSDHSIIFDLHAIPERFIPNPLYPGYDTVMRRKMVQFIVLEGSCECSSCGCESKYVWARITQDLRAMKRGSKITVDEVRSRALDVSYGEACDAEGLNDAMKAEEEEMRLQEQMGSLGFFEGPGGRNRVLPPRRTFLF